MQLYICFSVVRKFVHLLDVGDSDYTEEIELEKLRQQVTPPQKLSISTKIQGKQEYKQQIEKYY